MKTNLIPFALLPMLGVAAHASAQVVQTPSSPAPAPEAVMVASQRVDQTVYTQRLPSVAELTNAATAQGRTIQRVEQTASQVTVSYQAANGQVTTVAYLILPAAGTSAPTVVATPTPPPTTVVYAEPPPQVVYYSDGPYYYGYPRYYYPPVSLSLGFGFRGGHYYGGYRGGFHYRH